jgi:hypothetical protein
MDIDERIADATPTSSLEYRFAAKIQNNSPNPAIEREVSIIYAEFLNRGSLERPDIFVKK